MKLICLTFTFVFAANVGALANGLDALQGTWTTKKTGDNGPMTQTLEFKKNKWTFKLAIDSGGGFLAEGDVELKKAGGFETALFHVTRFGPSDSQLEDADEERNMVFAIQDGKLYIATNLDQERENEKPALDVYSKVDSKAADPGKGANEIVGIWKLELELAETKYDYTLRVAENDGKLSAVMVSPRSGEHKVKTISFENNALKMEIDREIENSSVTFVYNGKLEGKKLSGSAAAKRDGEEIATGTWEAKK